MEYTLTRGGGGGGKQTPKKTKKKPKKRPLIYCLASAVNTAKTAGVGLGIQESER